MLHFTSLELDRQKDYINLYRQCIEKASDYSFANIWAWADKYRFEWAWDNDLVWLRYRYGPLYLYGAPIGNWRRDNWKELLTANLEPHFIMTRVPESLSLIIKEQFPQIKLENQREHWEYIYNINDLIELTGQDYATKRKLANTFARKYPYQFRALEPEDIPAIKQFMQEWLEQQGQRPDVNVDDLLLENQSLNRVLEAWPHLTKLFSGSLWIEERLAAFTFGEKLDEQTVAIHFEKASLDYIGIYQAINRLTLASLPAGFSYVNREQDLGLSGLRKAKTEYRPVDFIRKNKLMYQINTQE